MAGTNNTNTYSQPCQPPLPKLFEKLSIDIILLMCYCSIMNIFYVSHNPRECAIAHVNSHCSKMCVEYTQLLSTAHRVLDGDVWADEVGLYKATHKNHPSAKWVRESSKNYLWLHSLVSELFNEYTYRYGRQHASARLLSQLRALPKGIPSGPFTQPPQAMPEYCKRVDSIEAYRVYYMTEKSHLAQWKNRNVPEWYLLNSNEGVNV